MGEVESRDSAQVMIPPLRFAQGFGSDSKSLGMTA